MTEPTVGKGRIDWRWMSRGLDGLDAAFDAVGALLRVLVRGRFSPDARSYRAGRFLPLGERDVLVQRITLTAEDEREARKIVALEPARYLALDPLLIAFDVAGPIDEPQAGEAQRAFLLGVMKSERMAELRKAAPRLLLGAIEGFAYAAPDAGGAGLLFTDAEGARLRRLRRLLFAVALAALTWSAWDAWRAWNARLEAQALTSEADELNVQGRIRLASRRLAGAKAAGQDFAANVAPPLLKAVERLETVAARLPIDAQADEVAWTPVRIDVKGRAWRPAAVELELRRGFEDAAIEFNGPQGAPAVSQPANPYGGGGLPSQVGAFQAAVTWAEASAPDPQAIIPVTSAPVAAQPR